MQIAIETLLEQRDHIRPYQQLATLEHYIRDAEQETLAREAIDALPNLSRKASGKPSK